jgi:hypothetical protein
VHVPTMREVTQEEYHAYIQRFPTRRSYRSGIPEPPQELCVLDDVLIGRIVLHADSYLGLPNTYHIRDEDAYMAEPNEPQGDWTHERVDEIAQLTKRVEQVEAAIAELRHAVGRKADIRLADLEQKE